MSPALLAGPYLSDLLAQPAALHAVGAALARRAPLAELAAGLRSGRYRRVVLTGMGSSLHALYPLHLRLSAAGLASSWIETSELLLGYGPLRAADTLLVAVSQSGESAEIVGLLKNADAFGHVVGVTNHPASSLGRAAGTVLPLCAGLEATVSCKTYIATLAALHWLGAALTGDDTGAALDALARVEAPMRAYLDNTDEHVAALADVVAGIRAVFVTGRGVSLATAGTGGLILKESTRQPAEGMSCAAFRHGPFEMSGDDVLVLVLAGEARVEPLHRRLVADIARGGGRAALLATTDASAEVFRLPAVPDALRPLVEILPVQMLSLALAARDGREAGRFERATKITTAE
jgi:glutamine---fructose-6-phosphate transaminase (isomerizing)